MIQKSIFISICIEKFASHPNLQPSSFPSFLQLLLPVSCVPLYPSRKIIACKRYVCVHINRNGIIGYTICTLFPLTTYLVVPHLYSSEVFHYIICHNLICPLLTNTYDLNLSLLQCYNELP